MSAFETLSGAFGFRGVFRDDADARAVYSESAGVARIMPRAVAVPADAEDVVALVRWAAAERVPLVPRGSGSSMANGAVGDGVIVDLGRLSTVGAPTAGRRRLVAEAAVIRDALQEVAATQRLSFPVDPSSGGFATIGGMVATHAAGARTVRYGQLRDWIAGVECVFADGSRAWVRRGEPVPPVPALKRFMEQVAPQVRAAEPSLLRHDGVRKESSGYALAAFARSADLLDVIIGSEGSLAIITAVEVRLTPEAAATASLLAGFADLTAAAATAVQLAALGASAVELLDRSFLEIAASGLRPLPLVLPPGLEAVLIIEAEAPDEDTAEKAIGHLRECAVVGGAVHTEAAMSAEDEAKLWQLRHAASPILNELAPRLQSLQLVEDGCVPPEHFAEYVRSVRVALDRARFNGVIFGHAGDAHAHVNALVDTSAPDWRARCEQLLDEVTGIVTRLGGTFAGEHGDGRLRTPLMARVWAPEAMALFAATKSAFDPDGILNPGVKVPLPGAQSLGEIKYDAALTPLPVAARRALDLVVREKGWARHRLDLLEMKAQG